MKRFMLIGLMLLVAVITLGAAGNLKNVSFDEVRAQKFVLVDKLGEVRAILHGYGSNSYTLSFFDRNEEVLMSVGVVNDEACITLSKGYGKVSSIYHTTGLSFVDDNRKMRILLTTSDNDPMIAILDEHGNVVTP